MKKKVALLVTCVGGALAPALLIELRRSSFFNYRLVGVNAIQPVPAQRILDAFYLVPTGDNPHYISKLLEVVQQEKIDVVLPGSDAEAFALSYAKSDLEVYGTRVIVSEPECLSLISDKHETYRNLAKAGLHVPEYRCVSDVESLKDAFDSYGYPAKTVVIKPAKGRGGRGLYVLCGRDNPPGWLGSGKRENRVEADQFDQMRLDSLLLGKTLVMPCLKTPAYDADVLFVDKQTYSVVVRRRINPTGIPFEGNHIVSQSIVMDYCQKIAIALGLKGLHDIDLMSDDNGNPLILEVNPRPSGSLVATLAAGFPLLDWAVSRIMGVKFTVFGPTRDLEILSFPCSFAIPEA